MTRAEVRRRAPRREGAQCRPCARSAELVDDVHLHERGAHPAHRPPAARRDRRAPQPAALPGSALGAAHAEPALGEHNDEVFA